MGDDGKGVEVTLEEIEEILRKDPEDVDALLAKAQFLAGNGEFGRAMVLLDKVSDRDRYNDIVILERTNAMFNLGWGDQAVEELDSILEARPDSAGAILAKAAVLSAMRDYEGALVLFDSFLERDPRNLDVLIAKSLTLDSMGRCDETRSTLEVARSIAPDDVRVRSLIEEIEGI